LIDIEKTVKINMLLDFYGNLLTKKKLEYLQLYYKEDLSLQEIASIYHVSRNAVYDMIQRTIKQLESYENKLHLLEKFTKRQAIIRKLEATFKDNKPLLKFLKQLDDIE
jgi:hypothetical protein